ncbi:hypothetical protein ACOALA_20580 (plasmid) [Alicyclobacillus acidoterrestris]|uniref:hypothetical protein n=1 Tax=Alicyclobacillus acidoterrestris TaxID=1450 RepID=UPI003F52B774
MNATIIVDTEHVQEIAQQCGPQALSVYMALQAMGNPISIDEIQKFCGLSAEATYEACVLLGLHNLGIVDEAKISRLRLVR